MEAKKQQHPNGTRGNRNFNKPDCISKHKPSKSVSKDERTTKIEIRLVHPRKCVLNKTIELYSLERETKKWEADGWEVYVCNIILLFCFFI